MYGGLKYNRKFGDLIIWKQIIEHVNSSNIKDVIFITDDEKSDWWWRVGGNTLGPRPELKDEIVRVAKVDRFHIYNTEQLLKLADKNLDIIIDKESVEQVKESKAEAQRGISRFQIDQELRMHAYSAVKKWIESIFTDSKIIENVVDFPDFIVQTNEGNSLAVEVVIVKYMSMGLMHNIDRIYKANYEISKGRFQKCIFFFIILDNSILDSVIRMLRSRYEDLPDGIGIKVARLSGKNSDCLEFIGFPPGL